MLGSTRGLIGMSMSMRSAPFSRAVFRAMRSLYPEELAEKSWDNTGRMSSPLLLDISCWYNCHLQFWWKHHLIHCGDRWIQFSLPSISPRLSQMRPLRERIVSSLLIVSFKYCVETSNQTRSHYIPWSKGSHNGKQSTTVAPKACGWGHKCKYSETMIRKTCVLIFQGILSTYCTGCSNGRNQWLACRSRDWYTVQRTRFTRTTISDKGIRRKDICKSKASFLSPYASSFASINSWAEVEDVSSKFFAWLV